MNISSNYYSPSFQKLIKMRPANTELIKNTALGSTATALGTVSIAAGSDMASTVYDKTPTVANSTLSPETIEFVKDSLLWTPAENGIPAQTSLAPSGLISSGIQAINKGGQIWDGKNIPD